MPNNLFSLLVFLITIFIVVCVHEFGHYIVAKCFGIKVIRFSIGFGKPIWKKKTQSGMELAIGWLPLGGYVRLLDEREQTVAPKDLPLAFNLRPAYQRLLVILAGPGFNFIFALLAFWIVLVSGITYIKPIIGEVLPNSVAGQAGLQAGQEIVAIDERHTQHWPAIAMALVRHYGEHGQLKITVYDNQAKQPHEQTINIDLRHWQLDALRPNPIKSLGIVPAKPEVKVTKDKNNKNVFTWPVDKLNRASYPFTKAFLIAWDNLIYFINFNLIVLYKILCGVISWRSLGGPFSIWQATVYAAGQGMIIYTNFLGLLSISIGIMNLVPIPGLDGAQLFYLFVEKILGKPISIAMQVLLFRLGFILLAILFTQVMINDLLRL